ncbi:MAG TPA: hypothetical protein VI456_01045 [Polyangia bacterium]
MEAHEGAPATDVEEPQFSEQIRRWLDEGDRLEAEVAARAAAEIPVEPSPVWRTLRTLGERTARHRVTVLASIGLLPLLLFLAIHRGAPPPALATATATATAAPAVIPPSLVAAAAPPTSPPICAAPPEGVASTIVVSEPVAVGPPIMGIDLRDRHATPHRHHHHHVVRRPTATTRR